MKAFEIFQEMKPETALSVFQFLRDEQREVYSASLATLAGNRKLRPVFIQRKPGEQQVAWMAKNIQLKGSAEIAEHVIQLWLLKGHQDLLIAFLDGVGIDHDGEGAAEDMPDKLDAKKLKATVSKLLQSHDPEIVRIYLHTFQLQQPEGWPELTKLIADTPELQFGEPEPEEVEESAPAPEEAEEPEADAPEETTSEKE